MTTLQRRRKAYSEVSSPAVSLRPSRQHVKQAGRGWDDDVRSEPPVADWKRPMSPTRSLKNGAKSSMKWTWDIFGSLYKVLFVLTGTTRTAVKVMQKKTPSFRNLKRLRKKAMESVKLDGQTWAKAAVAISLIFFSSMAVFFFLRSIAQVASVDKEDLSILKPSLGQNKTGRNFVSELSETREKALDDIIKDMVDLAVQNKIVELEDTLHRANQHYCIPQLSKRLTLDKKALTMLDTELLLLIDLLATKRVELAGFHDDPHKLLVESNGKLSFVEVGEWEAHKDTTDVALECPLVTHLYEFTQSKSNVFLPQKPVAKTRSDDSVTLTAAEFVSMIDDDDGTINSDIEAILSALWSVLTDGCSAIGKTLGLANSPVQMKMTPGLRKLIQEIISAVNSEPEGNVKLEAPVYVNSLGELFWGKSKGKNNNQCNGIATIIEEQNRIKGSKRVKVATLALLAHLFNVKDGDSVSDLIFKKNVGKQSKEPKRPKKPVFSTQEAIAPEIKDKPTEEWSVEEIGTFVYKLTGDANIQHTFAENMVDGLLYSELTDDILKGEFGIQQWGIRQKILKSKK